ncbi:aspartate aminotransferase, cytoplasmic [Parasteatoda tepidariorum]|uniref:aspartate aminotransferase, cytoplasmic n=1 Tax=Parasteatoda tepidariorum TaxID=114398 RepID=UPI00077FB593|nr:aspartate aminotransferase, cytoplasmic [Parasteatoda tepidariorum]
MSRFSCVEGCPPVEIFALSKAFKEDTFPDKVDLGIGAYRTDEAKPWVLPVVRKVETQIAADQSLNHEYLGQLGMESFSKAASAMLLGEDNLAIKEGRVISCQSLSGTGALRVGADFLTRCAKFKDFYMSSPTWPNHRTVFKDAGFPNDHTYRYWNAPTRDLNFKGMMEDLENAPEDSVIILHACAHNPTGVDPTQEQWKQIADLMEKKKLFPFFDCAYQGFASGDLVKDSWAVRYFAQRGFELICAQSFAKNFGLYNERAGNLTMIVKDTSVIPNIKARITILVRGNYSNPPSHGALIVSRVLNDKTLFAEWQEHITEMSGRIIKMRAALKKKLVELGTPGTWEHITSQIGMFSYTGLTPPQVKFLVEEKHIYLPKDGRISICGLNSKSVDYVAKAFHEAVTKFPDN